MSCAGLEVVAGGGTYFGPGVAALLKDTVAGSGAGSGLASLTRREREVLQLIAESHSTRRIAARLGVSAKTAGNHRTNLMRKLGVHDVGRSHPLRPAGGPDRPALMQKCTCMQ